jgi:hypothetical protein
MPRLKNDLPHDGPAPSVIAAEAYRRTPAADNEFPIFGLAEVVLDRPIQLSANAWRDAPVETMQMLNAFLGVGERWAKALDGFMNASHRLNQALDSLTEDEMEIVKTALEAPAPTSAGVPQ